MEVHLWQILVKDGPVTMDRVEQAADENQIGTPTMKRTRQDLNYGAKRVGYGPGSHFIFGPGVSPK